MCCVGVKFRLRLYADHQRSTHNTTKPHDTGIPTRSAIAASPPSIDADSPSNPPFPLACAAFHPSRNRSCDRHPKQATHELITFTYYRSDLKRPLLRHDSPRRHIYKYAARLSRCSLALRTHSPTYSTPTHRRTHVLCSLEPRRSLPVYRRAE